MTKMNGVFPVPGGKAMLENPDGTTCAYDSGETRNSLTNATSAYGGPDGRGYGAFPDNSGQYGAFACIMPGDPPRFRIG